MAVVPTQNAKLFIADPGPASPEPTWVEIAEIDNYGALLKQFEIIRYNSVSNLTTRKFKGSKDSPALEISFGRDMTDQGQSDLEDAADDPSSDFYWFKVECSDAPGGGSPTTIKFQALVASFGVNLGNNQQVIGGTATLEPDVDTITITAAAA